MPPQRTPRARLKLPPDHVSRLTDLREDIEAAREEVKTMKELGLDTRDIEEKLEWAAKARETLLKQFS